MSLRPAVRFAVRVAVFLAAAGPALVSCASREAEQAMVARGALVGMPKQTLLSCAGVPPRSRTEGNVEYYTYGTGQIRGYGPSFGVGVGVFGGSSSGVGGGIGLDTQAAQDVASDYCEATFTIVDGRVSQVTYNTVTGFGNSRYAQCYYIVANCLALQQRAPATGSGTGG